MKTGQFTQLGFAPDRDVKHLQWTQEASGLILGQLGDQAHCSGSAQGPAHHIVIAPQVENGVLCDAGRYCVVDETSIGLHVQIS